MSKDKIQVGISACVLGEQVRFDSGHKMSRFVCDELSDHFRFRAICPEVGMGMPVPRPTIRLMSDGESVRLVETKKPDNDHTDAMMTYSHKVVDGLVDQPLCGYIVCAKSPTCGMEKVKVYKQNNADKEGVGIYTRILMDRMPWLPVEEDGRLNDPVLRENFIARIYCLHDFYQSMQGDATRDKLVRFHSRYKLTLMAHAPDAYRELGRLVANIADYDIQEFADRYRTALLIALTRRASRKNNTNVLMHIQGYFKRSLNAMQKQELANLILQYRQGILPLIAPLTLIQHYLSTYPDPYLADQRYLAPYPAELKLRYAL
ncbi:DUF1722 domain-containing protein [Vibrio sp. SM6]|uniref:DUF1722 domain-containing protein n=1 Tax=Vibrio agarilyticus TaxID=2726741 RepID=A0A7X8TNJ7_9VIBR|nr:DUF523 and DUF1722 domain-containing protein [Vibrio agarilyticus]NLS11762.1 DUF1722 domain-containing protein [Vibrio agarilyticus]